jgi:hypothetical protein
MLEFGDKGFGDDAVGGDGVVGLDGDVHTVGGERQHKGDGKEEMCNFGQCVGPVVQYSMCVGDSHWNA